jgi:fructoselysine-6-P-deglycase FrlB-like protein
MTITAREIASQPAMWRTTLTHLDQAQGLLARPGEKILVLGCGTSAFVAESFAFLRENAGLGLTDAACASANALVPGAATFDPDAVRASRDRVTVTSSVAP